MAARPPREGLEFVPGTMEEVGVELLKHVDDPQDVIAHGGYGFFAPASAISKVKGAEKQEITNAPIEPRTSPHVEDDAYESREVDEFGQPTHPDAGADEVDLEANAPFPQAPDEPEVENTAGAEETEGDAEQVEPIEDEAPKRTSRKKTTDSE